MATADPQETVSVLVDIVLPIVLPLVLVVLGFAAGRLAERRHLRSLAEREAAPGPAATNLRRLPDGARVVASALCIGNVVIASDYFKTFGASLKTLVGGRLRTLETLLDRGRREAALRLREDAARLGADLVMNVRFETSIIRSNAAEVTAYGTAVKLAGGCDG